MTIDASTTMYMDQLVTQSNVKKPMWFDAFLKENFFESCSTHPLRKNELKKYCINCNMLICQHCVSFGLHRYHEILKVHRHLCKEVVPLRAIKKHFDCSLIQIYKRHGQAVISLNPVKLNELGLDAAESCQVCNRRLNVPDLYRYCSITCKVESVSKKSKLENPVSTTPVESSSVPSIQSPPPPPPRRPQGTLEGVSEFSFRKRKRKGIPQRAPLF
ncbi:protein RGF1 INDUCIBLE TRANSCRIPTION FACTOR 1-like [Trifolium pratense]|nr:protein RGF1 INDUCIBLE TRANSCRIPTION FACTOR 1-like [Trifolium pratense]XP_045823234.1 protein RGF1 INDUCIBLE TRANSCRIPTION FACTOR 1-like [Trifolium pratense]